MTKKLSLIFSFHVLCLGLLFVPDKFQGPVVFVASGINFRYLDAAAVLMMVLATVVMYIYIFKYFLPQIKQLQEAANRKKTDSDRKV